MTNTAVSDNIIIQDVSENSMTLDVNGEVRTIQNQLSELKEILKSRNISNITYENKIYNIEHINEANFGVVTSKKVFNGVLTKQLMLLLKDHEQPHEFFNNLPTEDKENWESKRQSLKDAQGILEDSFVWVIGWELRRLFSIGNDRDKRMETKIDEYINHCFSTYRISLQLIIYLFISKLWDEKTKHPDIDTDKKPVRDFFNANRVLKLAELRHLFQVLIEIFRNNKIDYPIDKEELGDINEFLQPNSNFNMACTELEKLETIDQEREMYGLGHCHTAEISLSTVLSKFIFFTNYQLVTLKKIEYEEARNSAARYIKDLNILDKKETKNLLRILKYDKTPALTYSVFFRNENKAINLFPFLLDYNTLTNETDFQIFLYQCRENESGLQYFSVKSENEEIINYMATGTETMEIKSEEQKNELQKCIRLDLVVIQFEEAMNTILGTDIHFKPKGNYQKVKGLGNI